MVKRKPRDNSFWSWHRARYKYPNTCLLVQPFIHPLLNSAGSFTAGTEYEKMGGESNSIKSSSCTRFQVGEKQELSVVYIVRVQIHIKLSIKRCSYMWNSYEQFLLGRTVRMGGGARGMGDSLSSVGGSAYEFPQCRCTPTLLR